MIELSTPRILANPRDSTVELTRDELWQGLMWKAQMPVAFVEPIIACRVLERYDDGFLREIEHLTPDGGTELTEERVLLDPKHTVTFIRISGSAPGRIINEITTDDDGALCLQFHFILGVSGMTHRGPEELEYERSFASGYLSAVDTTLAALREFVRSGVDPTEASSVAVH